MNFKNIPKDGRMHKVPGYTGIKVRFLKQRKTLKEDWSYYIYYRIGGRSGKQILQKVGTVSQGMTTKKAYKIRIQKILESEKQNLTIKNILTIEKIWEIYTHQKKELRSFSSIKNLFDYLSPFYKDTPFSITTQKLKNFKQELKAGKSKHGKTLSDQTIVHILKLLRTLLNFSVKNGLCGKNEKLCFEIPNINNRVEEFLSASQLKRYINELKNEQNIYTKAFIMTALFTGMRKNAIYHLSWQDIDTKNNLIYLKAEYAKKKKAEYIPLPQPIKKILQSVPQKSAFLFLDKNNKPYDNYFIKAKKIKEKIGLPKNFRPLYMLRHNYASLLASHGVDMYTIQKLLTHNSPDMTQRYAHLSDKRLKNGSKIVSKIIQQYF